MNVLEFKAEIIRRNYTLASLAKELQMNKATLHRKINGESDFTREEMQAVRGLLSLSDEMFMKIFFE